MVETVKGFELRLQAKLRQNRLNRGRDITIFRFFQDGGRPSYWICNACVGTTHEGHLLVFFYCANAKCGWNRCSSLDNMHVLRFREFGLKTPIDAQKLGVLGFMTPKWGAMWKSPKKGTSLRESPSFELSCVKIRRRVWPVGEFLKKGYT